MRITCDVIQDLMPSYVDGIWKLVRNAEKCWSL